MFAKNYVVSNNFNIGIFVCAQLVFTTSFTYKTNKRKGKKPLVDYSQSHVVTYDEYLNIMWKKATDKAITKEISADKWKEREEEKLKTIVDMGSTMDQTIQRIVEKQTKKWFVTA